MKLYTELEDLNFFEWLAETHNLADTDMKPEYLDELPIDDIHRTVCNAMVFRWFREKFNYHHTIKLNKKYVGIAYSSVVNFSIDEFNTYEEAEVACLKKLIEIANDKQ
jgi:hypothetical protein